MNKMAKAACQLLVECMDELRSHDLYKNVPTDPALKAKLRGFLTEWGLALPEDLANRLCTQKLMKTKRMAHP